MIANEFLHNLCRSVQQPYDPYKVQLTGGEFHVVSATSQPGGATAPKTS